MTATTPPVLYHISQTAGIMLFQPRRCWFDASRHCSGMLQEGEAPPPGCTEHACVFAGDARLARFFCIPARMKRFSIRRLGAAWPAAVRALGLGHDGAEEILLLEASDQPAIRAQRMVLYEFAGAPFTRYPAGEYVAEVPVVPLRETAIADPLAEMQAHGIAVAFVAEVERAFATCLDAGVPLGLVANIAAAIRLLQR
jgi:hypothetical protein